jgi:presenilin-like A22 family membrane protease
VYQGLFIFFNAYFDFWQALALATFVGIAYFLVYNVLYHNVILALGLVGVSVVLGGAFDVMGGVVVATALLIYDYWAVIKKNIMVPMFSQMVSKKLIMAFVFPRELHKYMTSMRMVQLGKDFVFLGTGDIVVPLLVTIPIFRFMPHLTLSSIFSSVVGMMILIFVSTHRSRQGALPGLPFIVGSQCIALFAAYFFFV